MVVCALLSIDVAFWCYFMQYDDHGHIGTTWCNVDIYVVDYVKNDHINIYAHNVKVWWILGDHVRLWLCAYICSLRVDAWLFLLTIWVYNDYFDDVVIMYRVT